MSEPANCRLWAWRRGHLVTGSEKFVSYRHEPENPDTVSAENVRSVYEDSEGIIWLGTYGGGLNAFDPKTGKMTYFLNDPKDPYSLSDNWVYSIYEDKNKTLWLGTRRGGLNRFDRDTKKFIQYRHEPDNPASLSDDYIYSIYEDSRSRFWIGTNSGAFNRFDRATGNVTRYPEINKPALCIHEDKKENLWVAGTGGMYLYVPETDRFIPYGHVSGNSEDLSKIQINRIFEDENGILWLGTEEGLGRFEPEAGTIRIFTEL